MSADDEDALARIRAKGAARQRRYRIRAKERGLSVRTLTLTDAEWISVREFVQELRRKSTK